jgi:hypothetical protein
MTDDQKPRFTAMPFHAMTADDYVALYRFLKGRELTEDEVARLKADWSELEAERTRRREAGGGTGG